MTANDPGSPHDERVRRSFERQLGLFRGPQSPFVVPREGALGWIEPLDPGMLVLDVACGAAHVPEAIAPRVRQVVGVDLTPGLLALGAARLRDAGVHNVLLQEGNAHALPFVDASFDLVYCRSSLHHIGDPRRAVAEMVRVCRPGGRIVLSDLIAPDAGVRERFDALHRHIDPSHARACLEAEMPALFPPGVTVSRAETATVRFPLAVTYTEQSDVGAAEAELRAEIAGGPRTGLDPAEQDGSWTVAFLNRVVHATRV
jgi:SAM-dependent methyltransferase